MARRIRLMGLAALLVAGTGSWAWSGEETSEPHERAVTLEQLPTWVKVTLDKAAGNHKIREIEEVMDGEQLFYEATWMREGREVEVKISPDGKLLSTEVEEQREAALGVDRGGRRRGGSPGGGRGRRGSGRGERGRRG